jgi:hypothetical protein
VRRLLRSPLGEAALAVAPAVLRAAGLAAASPGVGAPARAAGYTVCQVELDVVGPAVRRVVVRTASGWAAPGLPARREPRRAGWLAAGALGLGGLLVGLAAARRAPGTARPVERANPW